MTPLPNPQLIKACVDRLGLVVVTPLGRSGSLLAQSLLDGHPALAVFPQVAQAYDYLETFDRSGSDIGRWLDTNPVFFTSRSGYGFTVGNEALGRQLDAFFAERRTLFEEMFRHVCACLGGAESLDGRRLIAALAMSWAAIRGQRADHLSHAVIHHHNNRRIAGDMPAILDDFPEAYVLASCRHPIENALSFKTLDGRRGTDSFRNFSRNVRGWSVKGWRNTEKVLEQLAGEERLRLLDLNALHEWPEVLTARLAAWLGIEDNESLRHSTICGIPWLGNATDGRPIATFDRRRARLLYLSSIGEENGLTIDEYRFAEWFTRDIRTEAGYADPALAPKTGLVGFLSIAARNIEFFRKDAIPHDRGFRRVVRKFGYSELLLVVLEVLALKTSRRKSMRHLRLDDAGGASSAPSATGTKRGPSS